MTITTEEAERLAERLAHDAEAPQSARYQPYTDRAMHNAATTIRSLAAERDALRDAELDAIRDAEQKLAHRDNLIEEFVAIGTRERSKRDALQARVAELEGLAYGLMLAMSASRYDFAEILKEARAKLEGKP